MLLFPFRFSRLSVLRCCQRWQTVAMGEEWLGIESNSDSHPGTAFNLGSPSYQDYALIGDNKPQEIRTSLTPQSGWWRQVFPIPR
ncbi:MAG: hypothetical protein WBM62_21145 [Crocosphaera sp.]